MNNPQNKACNYFDVVKDTKAGKFPVVRIRANCVQQERSVDLRPIMNTGPLWKPNYKGYLCFSLKNIAENFYCVLFLKRKSQAMDHFVVKAFAALKHYLCKKQRLLVTNSHACHPILHLPSGTDQEKHTQMVIMKVLECIFE